MLENDEKKPPRRRGDGDSARVRRKLDAAPDLIPIRQVALKLGVDPKTIDGWIDKGLFPVPYIVIEHTRLFRLDQILHFLLHRCWPEGTYFRKVRDTASENDD